ncbi:MAG TPA: hypothetical protein VFF35_04955, partial [Bacteroidia bacterium]|nr:hypothetical protein [Bacteroidia bacterium]
ALRSTLHISKWRSWCSIAKPGISINFAAHGFWFGAAIATCLYAKNVSCKHCAPVGQKGKSAFYIEQLLCNFQHLKRAIASCYNFFPPRKTNKIAIAKIAHLLLPTPTKPNTHGKSKRAISTTQVPAFLKLYK